MKYREEALKWWRNLNPREQNDLIEKHFPRTRDDASHSLISMSSSRIEQMYINEIGLEFEKTIQHYGKDKIVI